jgi:hypothetical protein
MLRRSPSTLLGEEEKSWSWCESAKSEIFQVRGNPGAEADPLSWNFQHLADAEMLKFTFSPSNGEKALQHHPSQKSPPFHPHPV